MKTSFRSPPFGQQQQKVLRGLLIIKKKHTSISQKHNYYNSSILKQLLWMVAFPLKHACSSQGTPSYSSSDSVLPWKSSKLISLPTLTSPFFASQHSTFRHMLCKHLQVCLLFCLNWAMQSKAASPNRLPECICSSRNNFLQSLSSLTARWLLILCSAHLDKSSTHQK